MFRFYKKAVIVFLALATLTSLLAYVCLARTFRSDALLPAHKSVIPWTSTTDSDARDGGASSVSVNDSTHSLDFNITVEPDAQYPYASLMLIFGDAGNIKQVADFTQYSTLSFDVKCSMKNVLSFTVFSIDEHVTKPAEINTYRMAGTYFSCKEDWTRVEIDLRHLEVPEWWLKTFNFEFSDRDYRHARVKRVSFGSSLQSPVNTPFNIQIRELTLHGNDWRYEYAFWALFTLIWGGFVLWFFKQHTQYLIADIEEKLQKNRPLIAYQQLSIEPHKDKEKSLILRFMATEYADPDMSLETAMTKLGINRIKINDVLKEELGLTFIAYLNKLRLAEAARLLSEQSDASIAEIAYRVGYNNASYFNKLFKSEYGCTPKMFRSVRQPKPSEPDI